MEFNCNTKTCSEFKPDQILIQNQKYIKLYVWAVFQVGPNIKPIAFLLKGITLTEYIPFNNAKYPLKGLLL